MTNPISVSDLGVALATRGWKATICDSREFGKLFPKEELVDVDPAGYLKCVDGRGSDAVGKQQHGPKMLGGVYGIALNRGIKTTHKKTLKIYTLKSLKRLKQHSEGIRSTL